MPTEILIVQGFATFTVDTYSTLISELSSMGFSVHVYFYKTTDAPEDILKGARVALALQEYQIVLGHSLGGAVAAVLMGENQGKNITWIFSHAYLNTRASSPVSALLRFPLWRQLLMLPIWNLWLLKPKASSLVVRRADFVDLQIFQDLTESADPRQLIDLPELATQALSAVSEAAQGRCNFIWGEDDEVVNYKCILPWLRERMKKSHFQEVHGRHEPFNDLPHIALEYRQALEHIILK